MKYRFNQGLVRQKISDEKMTREEAAARIGISVAMFAHIMKSGECDGIHLGKLARFAGVPVYRLVI